MMSSHSLDLSQPCSLEDIQRIVPDQAAARDVSDSVSAAKSLQSTLPLSPSFVLLVPQCVLVPSAAESSLDQSDISLASSLLSHSRQHSISNYGAGSFLTGKSSDDPDAFDVAFYLPFGAAVPGDGEVKEGEQVAKAVLDALSGGQASPDAIHFLPLPTDVSDALAQQLSALPSPLLFSLSSRRGGRTPVILVGKGRHGWIGLAGVGVFADVE